MSGKQRTPRQLYRLGYAHGRKGCSWHTHPLRDRKAFTKGHDAGFTALCAERARNRYASL